MGADWIVRKNHPYDQGYWSRYDGLPRPSEGPGTTLARRGWDDCNAEIDRELRDRLKAET